MCETSSKYSLKGASKSDTTLATVFYHRLAVLVAVQPGDAGGGWRPGLAGE